MNLLALIAAASSLALSPGAPHRAGDPLQVGFTNVTQQAPATLPPDLAPALMSAIAPGGLIRFPVQWRVAQPDPDTPPNLDAVGSALVEPALAAGLRPLIVLTAAPEWAWGGADCNETAAGAKGFCIMPPGDNPADLARWAEFVQAVAQRWGEEVAGIEVWNEENAAGFWNETEGPDPAQYADVLCAAHDAVKRVSPGTPVILGGLAQGFETDAGHMSAEDFLTVLYQDPDRDVRECMDGIGVHPYPNQAAPNTVGAPFLAKLAAIRAVRAAHDDAGRPLWITEFGYHTEGPGAVTDLQQAQGLGCALRMTVAMPDVEAFVVHTLIDPSTPDPVEGSYGVFGLGPDGTLVPRPAAVTLHDLLADGFARIPAAPPC